MPERNDEQKRDATSDAPVLENLFHIRHAATGARFRSLGDAMTAR
jgi:hypothetical protein